MTARTTSQRSAKNEDDAAILALPVFSYKDYTPAPTVVYTRHEEEANDLVECLAG
jgi:hypothetical protein